MMYDIKDHFGLSFSLIEVDVKLKAPTIKGATNLLRAMDVRIKNTSEYHFTLEQAQQIQKGVEEIRDKCRSKFFYWIQAMLNPFSNAYKIENYAKSILLFAKKAEDFAKILKK